MQVPFRDPFYSNRGFRPFNNHQYRPNFIPRSPHHLRPPLPHWRQPPPNGFSNDFWCETCDRGFRTEDILEKHKQEHQKCNIDGCQFIAHPKVITKHIQMQHASGLYKKIAKLQNPEEIKKWREERRKKYPTKENVEKAAAAIKEKIDRGEKMNLKPERNERRPKTGPAGKRNHYDKKQNPSIHPNICNQNSAPVNKKRKLAPKNKTLPTVEDSRKLKPFGGIQDLVVEIDDQQEEKDQFECGFTIEDEDEQAEATNIVLPESSAPVCLALSSLQCNYGSSEEDEFEEVSSKTTIQRNKALETNHTKIETSISTPKSKNESEDEDGPEEVKIVKAIIEEPQNMNSNPIIHKKKTKDDPPKKPIFKRAKPKVPSTLLQKLLYKEMRQERNVVLQCIRHIVKHDFFDKSV